MTADKRLAALAKGREIAQERRKTLPRCTRTIQPPKGLEPRICRARTSQNEAERDRGVFWCPDCQRYPWGSGGSRAGGGPDVVPVEAWA